MKTFHRIPTEVCRRRDLTANTKLAYAFLASCVRMGRSRFPTLTEFEDELGVARATAIRTVKQLIESGLILRTGPNFELADGLETSPSPGIETSPSDGLKTSPSVGIETSPSTDSKRDHDGLKTSPSTDSFRYSAPLTTEITEFSQSSDIARAPAREASEPITTTPAGSEMSGARLRRLLADAVGRATGTTPWFDHRRALADALVRRFDAPTLEGEIAAFEVYLAAQSPGSVPDAWLRFCDRVGSWATVAAASPKRRATVARPGTAEEFEAVAADPAVAAMGVI